ncbi:MAG: hypothetical protein B7Z73_02910 [Planctomycetia bacterium 21-64-5]|nr:MAG: hypothetical protein B7Z73_02910 [Planctomycetia bacterium 21-64-5]
MEDAVSPESQSRLSLRERTSFRGAKGDDEPTPGVAFADRAAAAGIDFRYFNGADPASGTVRMFEISGGGAAVLDYDGDLWPDLYLTQGCRWPPDATQREHLDHLYRNLGGEHFQEVGGLASLEDNAFSQGAAIGDVDGDGFPDIYLGNIGPNRLYLNQGDGTFREVTETSGTAGDDWTASCALADFDGDGLADLYVVNYLAGDVFRRRCEDEGKPVQCAPTVFPAADDRLYRNLGDGAFEEVGQQCGAAAPDGKGLGLVVADFDGSRRLSVFVSNDTTANFFFANQTPARGGPLLFAETALISGLAFDEQGRAQACMGIALDDTNLDGRPDLFVTNFFRESNALYQQQADGSFRDESRAARLRDPSFAMLGWGTQFLDGELDGLPDLLVLNGHINEFSASGTPYRMPPQYFRNAGAGRFAESPAGTLGHYFQGRYLGRALARLDWNRDGLEDACATHVDAPVALLTNQTAPHGHFLAVRLVGVFSARDAVGATVRLRCGARRYTRQLTSGDGFQASNERRLLFGLGAAERIDELLVSWPAGTDQRFSGLPVDREMTIVEGQDLPVTYSPAR